MFGIKRATISISDTCKGQGSLRRTVVGAIIQAPYTWILGNVPSRLTMGVMGRSIGQLASKQRGGAKEPGILYSNIERELNSPRTPKIRGQVPCCKSWRLSWCWGSACTLVGFSASADVVCFLAVQKTQHPLNPLYLYIFIHAPTLVFTNTSITYTYKYAYIHRCLYVYLQVCVYI